MGLSRSLSRIPSDDSLQPLPEARHTSIPKKTLASLLTLPLSLDRVSTFAYHRDLKASELRRKLANSGCTFVDGKKHLIVYHKGNRSLMPRHPAKEVKTGTVQGILKKLGIEEL